MRKIVFITGIQVFPQYSGGHIRSGNLAKALARAGYEVSIYAFTGRKEDYLQKMPSSRQEVLPGLSEYVDRNRFYALMQWLTYRLDLPNFWFTAFHLLGGCPARLQAEIEAADIVLVDFPFHYPLLRRARGKVTVLNSHNLEMQLRYARWPRLSRLWQSLVGRIERKAAKEAQLILSCGAADAAFYREQAQDRAQVISLPNALDLELFPKATPESREAARRELGLEADCRVLLFTASKYGPNREAFAFLRYFERAHREELVRLKLHFLIVGSVADHAFREGQLTATSFVRNTAHYFPAADYALNPVVSGSGTNIKMFEYLAHELPILSTEFGARGFDLIPDKDYVVFEKRSLIEKLRALSPATLEMGRRAYVKNRHLCDMNAIVRTQLSPLLEKGHSRSLLASLSPVFP